MSRLHEIEPEDFQRFVSGKVRERGPSAEPINHLITALKRMLKPGAGWGYLPNGSDVYVEGPGIADREIAFLALHGIRRIRFHGLRHAYAALLIAQGENPKYIQNQLGQASIQTALDRCGHLMPETHQEAARRFDEALFGRLVEKW